jgi:hypothetical protein
MSDREIGIIGLTIVGFFIGVFTWYWRSTEWRGPRVRPDRRRYCITCGSVAEPVYCREGSVLIELFLLLAFVVPGIFYHFWRRSHEHWACAKCRSIKIIPLDSPVSVERLKAPAY